MAKTIGSALIIPDYVIRKMEDADRRLEKLQSSAIKTAESINSSFESMANGSKVFSSALDAIIGKLKAMGESSAKAAAAFNGIKDGNLANAAAQAEKLGASITRAAENVDRLTRKNKDKDNLGASVVQWQNINKQIDAVTQRQQRLTQLMRDYELTMQRINSGKRGVVSRYEQDGYKNAQKEYEANLQALTALRQKQAAIVANNQALAQQERILNALKSYDSDSNSLDNQRSRNALAQMREYYKEQEKLSAQQARESERRAQAEERARERKAAAEEKAREREAKAAEKKAEREAKAAEKAAAAEEKARERQQRAQAKAYQQQNYARNTTYSGALDFAESASTINRRAQAIKYLQAARASLSTTDSEYASKLNTLNARIKELNAANNAAIAGSKGLATEHRRLLDTTGQLSRAFALLFSVSQIRGYIESIATVRGEFEMSQRSLEAILQNKTEADEIFNKTVELAVKSPFRIKDLVSYTRQLAAYRIESDKLFDTTKRLADVSAGLGVDMGRLILAYGQVKAAAYLRGSEVRQFTEAGVNMYGELQRYFEEVKGEAYTTAQIVDMISRRMVTFEDVEAVFKRMTDAGGTFYNMQEIQSETLQGKISNFKDSIDVMLNSIGKANESTFKGAIDGATALMEHWEEIVVAGKALIGVLGLLKLYSLQTGNAMKTIFTANFAANGAGAATTLGLLSTTMGKAATAARMFGANLAAAFSSNLPLLGLTAVIMAVSRFFSWLSETRKEIERINKENGKLYASLRKIDNAYEEIGTNSPDSLAKKLEQLQKLQQLYEQEDIDIPVNIKLATDNNIDQMQKKATEYFKQYIKVKDAVEKAFADNESRFEWFGLRDNINEDAQDYANSYNEIIDKTREVESALESLYIRYEKLPDAQKKMLDDALIKKEGESDIKFIERQIGTLETLTGEKNLSYKKMLADFYQSSGQFDKELDKVLEETKKRFSSKEWAENGTMHLRAAIDKKAVEEGWDEIATEYAREHLGINVEVTEASVEESIDRVDAAIEDFFKRKEYKLNFTTDLPENFAFDDFDKVNKSGDAALKNIKRIRKELEQLRDPNLDKDIFSAEFMGMGGERQKLSLPTSEFERMRKDAIKAREEALRADSAFLVGIGRGNELVEKSSKKASSAAKQQRDILQEQISLLKEMQEQYEKLTPLMSGEDAARRVVEEYLDDLEYAKMPEGIIKSFVPTKQGLAKALNQLLPTIKDFKKKAEVMKTISQLEIEIDKEKLQKQLEGVKDEIDNAFNGLSLHDKLKDLGLSDVEIKRLFGPVTKSFAELREQIEQTFAARFGADKEEWGDDIAELYKEQTEKLAKQQEQQAASEFERLTKAYKSHLDDQLQLDLWYAKERRAIMENEQLAQDRQMRSEYMANLDKEYAQKSDANAWKQFQESDYYIRMFEDLEGTSSRMLNAMSEKLASLRESLKNLSPEQLKQVVDAQQKVDELAAQRNPFRTLAKNLGDYIGNLRKRKELEEEIVTLTGKKDETDEKARMQNQITESLRRQYEEAVAQSGAESERAKTAEALWQANVRILNNLREQSSEYQEQIDSTASLLSQLIRIDAQTKASLMKAGNTLGEAAAVIRSVFDSLNDWGLNVEMPPELEEIAGGFEKIDSSLQEIASGKVVSGAVNLLGGIGKTLGGIFGWGTKDKKLEERIEGLTDNVEKLQHAYGKLEQAQADAWSISDLDEYTQKLKGNLELQNRNLEAMIAAEQDKKDSDQDRIDEWQRQIDENLELIGDAEDRLLESLGGFGSESNYKSAAEEFAKAWVDAFNEGSDTLAALEGQFDEFIENLLTKQIAARLSDKIIGDLLKPLDEILLNYDGSPASLATIAAGLKEIFENSPEALASLNELMESLADVAGIKPQTEGEGLSALQQGIQGVTEQTAGALEALLNSVRFYVAQQAEDISAIRQLLSGQAQQQAQAEENPMVTLLREQSGYLRSMASIMESVWSQAFAAGHPKGGRGLKVFMD